ncbi:MAG: PA0069 family radical SAM protein [Alphaproteobacteria bacterium]
MSLSDLPGRGTPLDPANRWERLHLDLDDPDLDPGSDEAFDESEARPEPTILYRDATRSVLVSNDSPDVPFRWSVNPYRGCEHGCIYCYARPSHERLGWSAGLDFERRILVKEDAPALFARELAHPRWTPEVVAFSGNTDGYQPIERRLGITRRCLEVMLEFRNPVAVVTKSALVARDVDLLAPLAALGAARVSVSLTTLDPALSRRMEPRASSPERRLDAIARLADAGIPVHALISPVIPGLNDGEIPRLLAAAAKAGASGASWLLVRLAAPLDALLNDWLARHFPLRRARVLARIRGTRDGRLNDSTFGRRMRGQGEYAAQIAALFAASARRHGLDRDPRPLETRWFRRPTRAGDQLALF